MEASDEEVTKKAPSEKRVMKKRHSLDSAALKSAPRKGIRGVLKSKRATKKGFAMQSEESVDTEAAGSEGREITFTSLKSGYLKKRSMNSKYLHNWKSRYFLLLEGGLAYYRTELDAQAQGIVSITPSSACTQSLRYGATGFILSGVQQDLHMIADSPEEMQVSDSQRRSRRAGAAPTRNAPTHQRNAPPAAR